MNYFSGCTDLKSAKKVYIDLVKKHHPDKGGSERVMQEINHQFDLFKKGGKPGRKVHERYSTDHGADAFTYTSAFWGNQNFDFGSMYEDLRRAGFGSTKARGKQAGPKEAKFAREYAGEWSEDFEAKANKKAKQDAEELKARMEKLKEDIEQKKRQAEFEAYDRKQQEEARKMDEVCKLMSGRLNKILADKLLVFNSQIDLTKLLTPEDIKAALV